MNTPHMDIRCRFDTMQSADRGECGDTSLGLGDKCEGDEGGNG